MEKFEQKTESRKSPEILEQEIVDYIIETYKPRALVLHGSRASGNATEKSDWDFQMFVDEIKQPTRGFVNGENVEFAQAKLPVDPKDAFDKFGLKFRKGGVKIIFDPENVAQPIISACQNEIEKGFKLDENEKEKRKSFMEGMLSKVERYENQDFIKISFVGEFLARARNNWFQAKERRYSVPPYEALSYLQEKDPGFIDLLNKFAREKGKVQLDAGQEILDYLFK